MYLASLRTAPLQANLPILQSLIDARHRLAQVLGFPSFAHYSISSKMAQTPERAKELLHTLWLKTKAQAERELKRLQAVGFARNLCVLCCVVCVDAV
jgi:oligopeptidase A